MKPFETLLAESLLQESVRYGFETLAKATRGLIHENERLIQANRTGMIKDFEYWKAWNKVTDALKSELSTAEKKIGSEAMRNR